MRAAVNMPCKPTGHESPMRATMATLSWELLIEAARSWSVVESPMVYSAERFPGGLSIEVPSVRPTYTRSRAYSGEARRQVR